MTVCTSHSILSLNNSWWNWAKKVKNASIVINVPTWRSDIYQGTFYMTLVSLDSLGMWQWYQHGGTILNKTGAMLHYRMNAFGRHCDYIRRKYISVCIHDLGTWPKRYNEWIMKRVISLWRKLKKLCPSISCLKHVFMSISTRHI